MRPYANIFVLGLASCLDHLPKLQQRLLNLVQIFDEDLKVVTSPFDYMAESKSQSAFAENAPKWARRILTLTSLMKLIRDYKNFEQKNNRKVKSFAKILKEKKKKTMP